MKSVAISLIAISLVAMAGCNKGDGKQAEPAPAPLLLADEDVLVLRNAALTSGPSITGSIQPERRADLRAEVSAIVLAVLKENGDPVKRGDLLVRLDDTSIRDSLTLGRGVARCRRAGLRAGRAPVRAHVKRCARPAWSRRSSSKTPRSGATPRRANARPRRTRVVTARQQLERTEVRAPFDGVVSDRKVSAGDTAQIGKELSRSSTRPACASKAWCRPTAWARCRPARRCGSASTASTSASSPA